MSFFDLFRPKYDIKVNEFGNLIREEYDDPNGEEYKLYSVLDVARYVIVNFSYGARNDMTVNRLQILLYYCQVNALLRRNGCPLFLEKVYAFDDRVLITSVENEYKYLKNKKADSLRIHAKKYLAVENGRVFWKKFNSKIIERRDRNIIREAVNAFDDYPDYKLEKILRSQSPYQSASERENGDREILLDELYEYFNVNPEEGKVNKEEW